MQILTHSRYEKATHKELKLQDTRNGSKAYKWLLVRFEHFHAFRGDTTSVI
ncbi:hypothetical protein LINPERHAP1_LOCUS12995 [Linum perenne]